MSLADSILSRYRQSPPLNSEPITPDSDLDSDTDGERAPAPDDDPKDGQGTTPEPETLLHDDPFSSKTSKQLFNAIDELRKCGAGQVLDLPQLVIVGQQSAGKSSLLESLTDIPFPVGDGLCTRFATRIVSRRTAPGTADVVQVSVEPGETDPFGYEENDGPTGNFNPAVPSLTAEVFKTIVDQASHYMGIRTPGGRGRKNFSSKVLKIELSGPTRSHFGILDVPGVFSAKRMGITHQEMEGVTRLVTSYMQKKENIIICVVPANNDLSNQSIIDLALKHAANPSNVVGVFTKCDILPESEVVEIVKENKQVPLQSGWFVVQNKKLNAPSSFDREEAEDATLSNGLWATIPNRQRGTAALKKFLAYSLCKRIREVFPSMKSRIMHLLEEQRKILTQLGDERPTLNEQHKYLREIARRYQFLAYHALNSPEELPSDEMKLRGLTRTAAESFADKVKSEGHLYSFQDIGAPEDISAAGSPLRKVATLPAKKADALYNEIRRQIKNNRGVELHGMTNPKVLKPLFNMQTRKWEDLGSSYLTGVISTSAQVAVQILSYVLKDMGASENTTSELKNIIVEFEHQAHGMVFQKLHSYIHDKAKFPLQTNDESFGEKVKRAQQLRFKAALQRYQRKHHPEKFLVSLVPDKNPSGLAGAVPCYHSWAIVDVNDIGDLLEEMHPRGAQNTEDEIHDLLKAYYEIARQEYITYITKEIIEHFLEDPNGPVLGLSVEYIQELSSNRIGQLGGEDEDIIARRRDAKTNIEKLEEALRIADRALNAKGLGN
ncbi:hypothetical protein V494_03202 [Pseudogymnoascus sp. VKM F-4513 (FW-928)]|nr:hypothetical protein V494_03202 [Pseudogymnoascus sp. VKM F-4513 (FW-928)]